MSGMCAEGAIEFVDGKAALLSGDVTPRCLSQGMSTGDRYVVEREGESFDTEVVKQHLVFAEGLNFWIQNQKFGSETALPCGFPCREPGQGL